jgi:hypothetical protein
MGYASMPIGTAREDILDNCLVGMKFGNVVPVMEGAEMPDEETLPSWRIFRNWAGPLCLP